MRWGLTRRSVLSIRGICRFVKVELNILNVNKFVDMFRKTLWRINVLVLQG